MDIIRLYVETKPHPQLNRYYLGQVGPHLMWGIPEQQYYVLLEARRRVPGGDTVCAGWLHVAPSLPVKVSNSVGWAWTSARASKSFPFSHWQGGVEGVRKQLNKKLPKHQRLH